MGDVGDADDAVGVAEDLAGDERAGAAAGAAEDRADEREAEVLAEGLAGDEVAGAAVVRMSVKRM